MPTISIDKVIEANRRLNQYQFRLDGPAGLIYKGEVQLRPLKQHIFLGIDKEENPRAEIFWREGQGVGRKLASDVWLPLDDKPVPDYLGTILELMNRIKPVEVREDISHWVLEYQMNNLPIHNNPVEFFTKILKEPKDRKSRIFFDRVVEIARNLETSMTLLISKDDLSIRDVRSRVRNREIQKEMKITFEPTKGELPAFPERRQMLEARGVSKGMLSFRLRKFTGWYDLKTHCPWAQRSIQLIADKDKKDSKYREIYNNVWYKESFTEDVARKPDVKEPDPSKHHPLVVGAFYEDHIGKYPDFYNAWFNNDPKFTVNPNFTPDGYMRDYHHYGGDEKGLEYAWYFYFRGSPPTTVVDRYYSARDWGYGGNRIDGDLNRMTFTEAIRQYNLYTYEGKRNAFLMLGHVIHLLQDVAHPDHGKLVPHPGSGKNEKEAYEEYYYCHILAGEIAAAACSACNIFCFICFGAAFGTAEAACYGSIDENEMGYEKLIGEIWNLSQCEQKIQQTGILNRDKYDAFFHELCGFAIAQADQRNLESPLGCGWLKLVPPVPGADPDIQSNNKSERKPYIDLTNEIAPKIIGYSAGLIQYFYEIVNHPPFVERVVVMNGGRDLVPQGFAKLPYEGVETCYEAEWIKTGPSTRKKQIKTNKALNSDQYAYIFVQFGPKLPPLKSKSVIQKTLSLKLSGVEDGHINIEVPLKSAESSDIGMYYWGSTKLKQSLKPYGLQLEIQAEDASAHLMQRQQRSGYQLDSNPATVALVNENNPPLYNFTGYEPGTDKNHLIDVRESEEMKLNIIAMAWQILE